MLIRAEGGQRALTPRARPRIDVVQLRDVVKVVGGRCGINLSGDLMIDRWGADGGVAAKLRMSPARRSWSGSPSTAAVPSGCARPSNEITCAGAHSIVLLFVVGLEGWRATRHRQGVNPGGTLAGTRTRR